MRIALVSDIHGNLPALDAVAAEIADAGATLVLNLGDIVSGPLWPQETARRLIALGWPAIAGNHERQLLAGGPTMGASDAFAAARLGADERAWLAALPAMRDVACDAAGGTLRAVHGTPASDLQYLLETTVPGGGAGATHPGIRLARADEVAARLGRLPAGVEVLVCGHSHVPRVAAHGAVLLVNPGSVGLPAFDDDHGHAHVVENGSPHARWALLERDAAGRWRAELRHTPYDHEAAARRAEAGGRGDWADALRSGRVGRTEAQVLGT